MQYWNCVTIVLWGLLTGPVWAAYKCMEEGGRIFYQDAPCPAHTQGGELNRNANRTFAGQVLRSAAGDQCCAAVQETEIPPRLRKRDVDNELSVKPAKP